MPQAIAAQFVGLGGATDFPIWKLFLSGDWAAYLKRKGIEQY